MISIKNIYNTNTTLKYDGWFERIFMNNLRSRVYFDDVISCRYISKLNCVSL